ncbi:MAG: hypothetical protein ABJE66_21905 [Deltaproteobacteria bacterium]
MIRAGIVAICLLGACTTGDDPGAGGGGGGGGSGSDNNTLDRICTAQLAITGTFVPGQAAPLNPDGSTYEGCWPIGTWTFAATVAMNDCATAPTMLPSYAFVGTVTTDPQTGDPLQNFMYTTDPTAHTIVHVSEASNAQCEGEVDVYSTDGKQIWNMKPWLATGTITGEGEYSLYNSNQWTN